MCFANHLQFGNCAPGKKVLVNSFSSYAKPVLLKMQDMCACAKEMPAWIAAEWQIFRSKSEEKVNHLTWQLQFAQVNIYPMRHRHVVHTVLYNKLDYSCC